MNRDLLINKISKLLASGHEVKDIATEGTPKSWTVLGIDRIKIMAIPPLLHGNINYRVCIDDIELPLSKEDACFFFSWVSRTQSKDIIEYLNK